MHDMRVNIVRQNVEIDPTISISPRKPMSSMVIKTTANMWHLEINCQVPSIVSLNSGSKQYCRQVLYMCPLLRQIPERNYIEILARRDITTP